MLAKAQIDLDDLRTQYQKKVESEIALIELVTELRDKLSLASEYYFELQRKYPEIDLSSNDTEGS